ncbi:MAG TPA: YkgJ family cysteine cluster protein [Thermoanaerobaculia bacterium]|nr:YkgJ family cysteine cluster protein [Thermoanaerobaculia bacterium]
MRNDDGPVNDAGPAGDAGRISRPTEPDLADLERQDDRWIERVDAAMAEAARACRGRWGCGPGRVQCCIGPFPIHQLDAQRLRRGRSILEQSDPARAAALASRVETAVGILAEDFPGDLDSGVLDDDEEELERLCEELQDQPCPVLDPETGRCDLYAHRPRVCRTFGPPLRLAHGNLEECPYCFDALRSDERESLRVEPDREGQEKVLLERLESTTGASGLTLIALALRPRLPGG